MNIIDVEIRGKDPGLLMRRFPGVIVSGMKPEPKISGTKRPTREQDAEIGCYRLESGELCQPADGIHAAMVKTASEFKIGGRGNKTYRDAVSGLVTLSPMLIPHGTHHYEIDSRAVVIKRARIIRHRAWLPAWRLCFQMQIEDGDLLPPEMLHAILGRAGEAVGIGDFRPRFGKFMITKWEPQS